MSSYWDFVNFPLAIISTALSGDIFTKSPAPLQEGSSSAFFVNSFANRRCPPVTKEDLTALNNSSWDAAFRRGKVRLRLDDGHKATNGFRGRPPSPFDSFTKSNSTIPWHHSPHLFITEANDLLYLLYLSFNPLTKEFVFALISWSATGPRISYSISAHNSAILWIQQPLSLVLIYSIRTCRHTEIVVAPKSLRKHAKCSKQINQVYRSIDYNNNKIRVGVHGNR